MVETTSAAMTASPRLRRDGWLTVAGGLVGVAQAVFLLVTPRSVGTDRFSYPFKASGFMLAQSSFFAQHLLLVFGLWALYRLPALRRSRVGRIAAAGAATGMVLLALVEIVAIAAADSATTGPAARTVGYLYGVPVILLGISLLTTGIAALRSPRAGWAHAPWLPLIITMLGAYVFVPLTPAIAGPFVAGRLGIGGWMLLFAVMGYGLTRVDPTPSYAPPL